VLGKSCLDDRQRERVTNAHMSRSSITYAKLANRGCLAVLVLSMAAASAATFTVTTTNDSGAGSLRDALTHVNASPGPHLVQFTLPGSGV
jgi:hypothetical protein